MKLYKYPVMKYYYPLSIFESIKSVVRRNGRIWAPTTIMIVKDMDIDVNKVYKSDIVYYDKTYAKLGNSSEQSIEWTLSNISS